jgi:hypothetical protein
VIAAYRQNRAGKVFIHCIQSILQIGFVQMQVTAIAVDHIAQLHGIKRLGFTGSFTGFFPIRALSAPFRDMLTSFPELAFMQQSYHAARAFACPAHHFHRYEEITKS